MGTFKWYLIGYLAISVIVGARLMFLRYKAQKQLGVKFPPVDWPSLIFDSVRWGVFVLMYGLVGFYKEMKDV